MAGRRVKKKKRTLQFDAWTNEPIRFSYKSFGPGVIDKSASPDINSVRTSLCHARRHERCARTVYTENSHLKNSLKGVCCAREPTSCWAEDRILKQFRVKKPYRDYRGLLTARARGALERWLHKQFKACRKVRVAIEEAVQ